MVGHGRDPMFLHPHFLLSNLKNPSMHPSGATRLKFGPQENCSRAPGATLNVDELRLGPRVWCDRGERRVGECEALYVTEVVTPGRHGAEHVDFRIARAGLGR